MAYQNLVAESISSRAEAFKRFRDWMCKRSGSYDYSTTGLGWTLHDSSYATDESNITAGDYYVLYSAGESGKEDLYMKVTYSATANINQITMHLYWNASTHAGVTSMTAVSNWQVADVTAGTMYIYADMDSVVVGTYIGTGKYACAFGILDALYDRTIATSAGSVTAGSSVVITVDAVPASWVVGKHVVIRDNANIERIAISNISGTDVTFTTVVASYSAGCKLAQDYPVACSNSNSLLGAYIVLFSHDGSKLDNFAAQTAPISPGTSGDPDPLDSDYLAISYSIRDITGGYMGTIRNTLVAVATGYTDLNNYILADSTQYKAFVSWYSSATFLLKEV